MSAYDEMDTQPGMRLATAAEQLRLAATALSALASLVDEADEVLTPHVSRLESRAVEMMRTTRRLATDMGVARRWGLDILFSDPVDSASIRQAPAYESIELEPIDLLQPVTGEHPAVRSGHISTPPWAPQIVLPTPPLDMPASADESIF